MNKKHIITLATCAAAMFSILLFLYATSPLTKELYRGGFERTYLSNSFIKSAKTINLPYNSYYIAGVSKNQVYFGNYTNPLHLIQMNMTTLDSQHIKISLKEIDSIRDYEKIRVRVDSPYFFLFHGTEPKIFRGTINNPTAHELPQSPYFVEAEPISKSSFAFRSYSTQSKSMEIAKKTKTDNDVTFNFEAIEKQIDGIFCTQGILTTDISNNKIVYAYTYRNEYIVMDTNLLIQYKSHTLDTFTRARIRTKIIDQNETMSTGIPRTVNTQASVSDSLLLIKSAVLSKNEDLQRFITGSAIDIFQLGSTKYLGSIHIPNYSDKHLSDIKISHDKIITLHGEIVMINLIDKKFLALDYRGKPMPEK